MTEAAQGAMKGAMKEAMKEAIKQATKGALAFSALAALLAACDGGGAGGRPSARARDAVADEAANGVQISRSTHTGAPEPPISEHAGDSGSAARSAAIEDGGAAPVSAADQDGSSSTSTSTDGEPDPDEPLVGEARERDPRSDTVKIKIVVDSRRQAHVIWGRKDFGVAPLEIERPRNSGPLDLVVVTPGYLPLHARAFTDRDDVLPLHLYTPAEAPQLLGYRAEPAPAHDSGERGSVLIPNPPQNKGANTGQKRR